MNYLKVAAFALAGVGYAPFLRAMIFRHAVAARAGTRESCPHCGHLIIASRLGTDRLPPSGLCPRCRQPIGPAAGSVEFATAGGLALVAWCTPDMFVLLAVAWVIVIGVALAAIDLAVRRLPDRLIGTALAGSMLAIGVDALAGGELRRLILAVLCALATATAYLLLALLPRGISLGDAKLGLVTGLVAGWLGPASALVSFGSAMALLWLTGVLTVIAAWLRGHRAHAYIPHGPHMIAGLAIAVCLATAA